eukprot:XP_002259103.1 hypothetical protein, conserved in Plasmodium species [Plasmodium knowlesi strain H]
MAPTLCRNSDGPSKGKGLGKLEDGDVSIMKIRKYGEHGLGYEERQKNEDEKGGMWWEDMYNNCAKKINQGGTKNSLGTSEKKPEKRKKENIKYSIFVKKSNTSLNSASDKCVSSNEDDQSPTNDNNSEKSAIVEEGKKIKEECTDRANDNEIDSQIKAGEANHKWKIKTDNALINKVAIISKVKNWSKNKKKWKKRNVWGKYNVK